MKNGMYLFCRNLHDVRTIWTKDSIPIEDAGIEFNFKDSWNRTLIFVSKNLTYTGEYACHVSFRDGIYSTLIASANVTVLGERHILYMLILHLYFFLFVSC